MGRAATGLDVADLAAGASRHTRGAVPLLDGYLADRGEVSNTGVQLVPLVRYTGAVHIFDLALFV